MCLDEGATGRGAKPKAGLCGFSVSNLNIPGFEQPWEIAYGKPASITSALDIMIDGPLGAAAFGNEFGRPTVCGYFRTYEAWVDGPAGREVRGYHKPIMLAGGLGNIREEHVEKAPYPPGTALIVLGGPAFQIGLGGGAASSTASVSGQEELDFASVQRDNPEMQRRCQEVIDGCWQLGDENPLLFIHDVGAGGLSNALPELVSDAGRGGHFELRDIPVEESGMSPLALWCNESQERYVMAVDQSRIERFAAICQRERCPWAVVGRATEERLLTVHDRQFGDRPVDMPLDVLLGKPPRMQRTVERCTVAALPLEAATIDLQEAAARLLRLPAVASKSFLITIADRSVGGMIYRDQMVGPWQLPVADCAVSTSGYHALTGEAMAMGERAPIALLDAKASARMAVAEAITNIAPAGIEALSSVSLSANWMSRAGHPGEDERLYEAVQAVGMALCPELGITIPVGKDSLSMGVQWQEKGEEKSVTAPLSLVISAFAPVSNVRRSVTPQLQLDQGDTVLMLIDLGRGQNRLGGSALAQVYGQVGHCPPDLDRPADLKGFFAAMAELIAKQLLLAYHDRSDGGLFVTLLEMAFAAHTGLSVDLDELVKQRSQLMAALFAEELGAVVQIRAAERESVAHCLAQHGLSDCLHPVGQIRQDGQIRFRWQGEEVLSDSRVAYQKAWSQTSYHMQSLRDNDDCARQEFDHINDAEDPGLTVVANWMDKSQQSGAPRAHKGSRPRVAILREQGVNGHVEMAAAFDQAGFQAVDVHMSDLIAGNCGLADFHGLVACGGFSYGDVLGAGQGWARSILFSHALRDQFEAFFSRQQTFALGVCNGCQMLSSLRELIPGTEGWPHFVRNHSEQFEARLVTVQIEPCPSILLAGMQGARLPVAVAHGEGQALFDSARTEVAEASRAAVALRYVDNYGAITERYPFNPNGSGNGVTGLTNDDGRVTIMMPHPERVFRTVQHSWHPTSWQEEAPWMKMFHNARAWLN